MIPAVHPVVIHEHLMDTRLAFEPYDVHPGESGLCSGDRPGVEPLDGYPLGEEIELHYRDVVKGQTATDGGTKDTWSCAWRRDARGWPGADRSVYRLP